MISTEIERIAELDIEKAMKAIQNYNQALENLKDEGLTDRQVLV